MSEDNQLELTEPGPENGKLQKIETTDVEPLQTREIKTWEDYLLIWKTILSPEDFWRYITRDKKENNKIVRDMCQLSADGASKISRPVALTKQLLKQEEKWEYLPQDDGDPIKYPAYETTVRVTNPADGAFEDGIGYCGAISDNRYTSYGKTLKPYEVKIHNLRTMAYTRAWRNAIGRLFGIKELPTMVLKELLGWDESKMQKIQILQKG